MCHLNSRSLTLLFYHLSPLLNPSPFRLLILPRRPYSPPFPYPMTHTVPVPPSWLGPSLLLRGRVTHWELTEQGCRQLSENGGKLNFRRTYYPFTPSSIPSLPLYPQLKPLSITLNFKLLPLPLGNYFQPSSPTFILHPLPLPLCERLCQPL